jgi:signal peptidase II
VKVSLRLLAVLFVLATCVGCDQATKSVARETLAARPPVYVLDGVLRLQYAENPGAFLSLGANLPGPARTLIFAAFVSAILAACVVYIVRTRSLTTAQLAGLTVFAGGGIGNLIDRIFHGGSVVDFAVLSLGPLHTGVFNVADLAIVGGLALFACASVRELEDDAAA